MRYSMRDIAKAAGVSAATVSLALKNHPRISDKTRIRIQKISRKFGYKPDPVVTKYMEHLRVERSNRAATKLAVLIPELTQEDVKDYHPIENNLKGIREQAYQAGFEIEIFYLKSLGVTWGRMCNILHARGITNVILAPFKSGVGKVEMNLKGLCVATTGYSIIHPNLNRACPDYLQMMDELLEHLCESGFERIGLIMTYGEGGIGHKLFSSSFLYYQSKILKKNVVPILPKNKINDENIKKWINKYHAQVIISSGEILNMIKNKIQGIPNTIEYASLDLSEPPFDVTGMFHRHAEVGREAVKLVLTSMNFNQTGTPQHPKIVLVDSYLSKKKNFKRLSKPISINLRKTFA